MIGTHNSFTYLEPKYKIFKLFSFLWKTQTKNLKQQKDMGVSYFDIRIRRVRNNTSTWRICHGLVDFNKEYDTIAHLLEDLNDGVSRIRLILERGDEIDQTIFKYTIKNCADLFPLLSFSAIKHKWIVLVDKDPIIKDYCHVPWNTGMTFWDNIKRFNFLSTIKKWSKKHNPLITKKMIKDEDILYFMDYL